MDTFFVTTTSIDDNSQNNFSLAGFNNTTSFNLNDFFFGLHYKFRKGIFTFKQGVYLHKYDWKVKQKKLLTNDKWVILPDFLLKIEFNNSKKIQLNYNLKSNFSEASKLANRFFDTLIIQKGLSKILIDVPTALLQIFFGLLLLSFYHPFLM